MSDLTRDALKMAVCWAAWVGRDARELHSIRECVVNLAVVGAAAAIRRDMARMAYDIDRERESGRTLQEARSHLRAMAPALAPRRDFMQVVVDTFFAGSTARATTGSPSWTSW